VQRTGQSLRMWALCILLYPRIAVPLCPPLPPAGRGFTLYSTRLAPVAWAWFLARSSSIPWIRSALRTTERAKSNRAASFAFSRHHEFLWDLRASLPIFEHLVHSFYLFEPDRVRLLGHRHVAHNAVGKPLKFPAEFFDFSHPPSERASLREALASSMFTRRTMRGSAIPIRPEQGRGPVVAATGGDWWTLLTHSSFLASESWTLPIHSC
jgi:hypothetical protein